ncbi:hypothetical protein THIAE_01000 [Thiomicrospira aerophila AL3]|uniref:Uncharacterized protein n=1 Tax=Thiomicrospira aerophila AL3 TaxID=717772 RepID=W0DZB9_9GAMM|nr:hypothetical protein [Thiomicrospira aerophila]AHF02176.1 hypothetical protein THIAE_01000 [Thiomicrospira aerophila AL3]
MKPEDMFSPAIDAFFERLIHREQAVRRMEMVAEAVHPRLDSTEIVHFFRILKGQNIFIQTIGLTGKLESNILSNVVYNFNDEIRLYYSQSLDDSMSGFIRVCPDIAQSVIAVDNIYGEPLSQLRLYQSPDQKAILKYMIRWLLKRIDWNKTRLDNIDLYHIFLERKQAEAEAEVARLQDEFAAHQAQLTGQSSKNKKQVR